MIEKKKTKQIFFLRCDVYEKGADSSRKQTKNFELLMLGVEWRFYSHYQIFPLKKYCFAPILQIGLRVFFVFWRVFFWLNFRIGLENCTWSVNSDIIQLIFFRGEGVFVFFIFIFIYPAAKKYGSLLFSSHLFPWYKTGWESLNWFTAEILIGRYFKPCFHIFLLIPVIWIRSTSLKSRKNPALTR